MEEYKIFQTLTHAEMLLHLTDVQVNNTEPIGGHIFSIPGHRLKKLRGNVIRIAFKAIGATPAEQPWLPVEIENFGIEKFELVA